MKKNIQMKLGDQVIWPWLGKKIEGRILEIFYEKTIKTIKGKNITRNGTADNPAVLVISESGNEALKLMSELTKMNPRLASKSKPKMFS